MAGWWPASAAEPSLPTRPWSTPSRKPCRRRYRVPEPDGGRSRRGRCRWRARPRQWASLRRACGGNPWSYTMKVLVRGLAALFVAATLLAVAPPAAAQGNPALASETDRISYMVGHDVARSIEPAAPDIDLAAFEEAIRNALDGGKPLIAEADVQSTGQALMMRVASRAGRAPAGAEVPEVDRRKAGHLVGADVGRSLVPMKADLSVPPLLRGLRDTFAGGELAMAQAELDATREAFARKMQASMQQRMQA